MLDHYFVQQHSNKLKRRTSELIAHLAAPVATTAITVITGMTLLTPVYAHLDAAVDAAVLLDELTTTAGLLTLITYGRL